MATNMHGVPLTEPEGRELLLDPYELQPRYGHITLGVLGAIVLFGVIGRLVYALRSSKRGERFSRLKFYRKSIALGRFLTSRKFVVYGFHLPTLGASLVIGIFSVFLFAWGFGVLPYYMSAWGVSSPPLAMRTGFFTAALFPYIYALSAKFNIISFITGISHEKLLIFHKSVSWLFFFFGLVHTLPYCIQGTREMAPDGIHTQLELSWFVKHKIYYPTGVALNIVLFWLCFASFGIFRRKAYEFFKLMHILAALAMLPLFVLHCNNQFDSAAYCWAGISIYGSSVLARCASLLYRNSAGVPFATFEVMPSDMVKVVVYANPLERWRPGQHYFFNFAACAPLTSHPFTVASIPTADGDQQKLVLLIRKQAGLTKAIAKAVSGFDSRKRTVCLIDGPYGGISKTCMAHFEHVVLIAGGSGVTFTLPILQDLVRGMHQSNLACKSVDFIWCVRDRSAIKWIEKELLDLVATAPASAVRIMVHVTSASSDISEKGTPASENSNKFEEIPADKEDSTATMTKCCSTSSTKSLSPISGRPDLSEVVRALGRRDVARTAGIAVCGPTSMLQDVRKACAEIQTSILRGTTRLGELFLHTEEFDW